MFVSYIKCYLSDVIEKNMWVIGFVVVGGGRVVSEFLVVFIWFFFVF